MFSEMGLGFKSSFDDVMKKKSIEEKEKGIIERD